LLAVSVVLFFFCLLAQIRITDIFFAFFGLFLCGAAEKIGVSWKLQQPDTEDPLLAAVDLLESNWKLVQEVSPADSLRADVDVCQFMAEEERGDAG
jgi:hypothetical protein